MKYIVCLLVLASNLQLFAQTDFVPGFYIVNKNAKYGEERTLRFDYMPYFPETNEDGESFFVTNEEGVAITPEEEYLYLGYGDFASNNIKLREGQVVVAYMLNNDRVYCFDLDGHPAVFSSIKDLTKAPSTGSIGLMNEMESEEIMDGPTIANGYYWILSQNTANGTVKIQLPKNTVEIKSEKLTFWKKAMDSLYDDAFELNENEGVEITIVK